MSEWTSVPDCHNMTRPWTGPLRKSVSVDLPSVEFDAVEFKVDI